MPEENYKRLFRSKKNRVFLGVCGGIGEYFNTDPVIVRLAAVVLVLASVGFGIFAYLVAAIIIPEEA